MLKPLMDSVSTPSFSPEQLRAAGFISIDPYLESLLRQETGVKELSSVSMFVPSAYASLDAVLREVQAQGLVLASASSLVRAALENPALTNIAALVPVFLHAEYGPQVLMVLPRVGGRALVLEPLPERWPAQIEVLVVRV